MSFTVLIYKLLCIIFIFFFRSLSVVENSAVQNEVGNALRKVKKQVKKSRNFIHVGFMMKLFLSNFRSILQVTYVCLSFSRSVIWSVSKALCINTLLMSYGVDRMRFDLFLIVYFNWMLYVPTYFCYEMDI